MIKLAIIGTGSIAQSHAQAAARQGNCQLAAVVNHRQETMSSFAKVHNIGRQHLSLDEMIELGGIDAAIVCTPNALHAPQTISLLKAGIHVLVEKPMSLDAAEARGLLQISAKSKAMLQVAHCLRFLPDVQAMRRALAEGVIGPIIRTHSMAAHSLWGPSGWFTDHALAGGGALIDMGIHAIDTVRFILGDPKPESVYASIGTYHSDSAVDDSGFIVINWSSGIMSTIQFGWWQPYATGVVATTRIVGQRGSARLLPNHIGRVDPSTQRIEEVATNSANRDDLEVLFAQMYRDQLAAFLKCIETDNKPMPGADEGLVNMCIVDAAYQSSRSGEVVWMEEALP